jgi:hypothetical protein
MVRRRLFDVTAHAFPRFEGALGRHQFEALFDRFLEAGGPGSPFVRDAPGEFLASLEASEAVKGVPASSMDLARYEWAHLATSYAADGPRAENSSDLHMAGVPALLHARRLLALSYPVHRIDRDAPLEPEATFLCVYRDPETHEVKTLELSFAAYALLQQIELGECALKMAIEKAAARVGATLDRPFLEATSAVIADFVERGLLMEEIRVPAAGK